MKLIIDIDEETYKMCKRLLGDADDIERAIANGKPVEETSCDIKGITSIDALKILNTIKQNRGNVIEIGKSDVDAINYAIRAIHILHLANLRICHSDYVDWEEIKAEVDRRTETELDIPFTSLSCPCCGNNMWGYVNGKVICAVCGNYMGGRE